MVPIGVLDPDSNAVSITVIRITEDEPVLLPGSGDISPDSWGVRTDTAWVRAERSGKGNGRVYNIHFVATDAKGGQYPRSVLICVPHDQGTTTICIDDGQIYDSTVN